MENESRIQPVREGPTPSPDTANLPDDVEAEGNSQEAEALVRIFLD